MVGHSGRCFCEAGIEGSCWFGLVGFGDGSVVSGCGEEVPYYG